MILKKIFKRTVLIMVRCSLVAALFQVAGVLAWDGNGHRWIAQSAASNLTARELEAFDQLLKGGKVVPAMLFHASVEERIGAAAAWPDRVRDLELEELFAQYGSGQLPEALASYAAESTSSWHYTNDIFVHPGDCRPQPTGKLLQVWPDLLRAYGQARNPLDKNILLAMALHLAADAYQPLHLMSAVGEDCKIDRGGNGECVLPEADKTCKVNLHQLWDEGFGVFEQPPAWLNKLHPTNVRAFDTARNLADKLQGVVYPGNRNYRSQEYLAQALDATIAQTDYAVGHTKFLLQYLLAQQ